MESFTEDKIKMQLKCPMPAFDFDRIMLGHGSGGTLTNRLLETGVFNLLKNPILDTHHDGAILPTAGKIAFTTDSFVISPIFFPGGDIGQLAVNGTVNDLAMCGARPKFLSLSFIIEEGLLMEDFWRILVSIKDACFRAGVQVVTGDTKVVEKGKGDQIFINTCGVGNLLPNGSISIENIKNGDVVIVSNNIAAHGIAIMSKREGLEFESDILSDTQPLHGCVESMINHFGSKIHLLKDPTRGGLASVFNEIARDCNYGIQLIENQIPIDPQVYGACEILGLDPLYVANEGVFVAVVDSNIAEEMIDLLRTFSESKNASIIGSITEEHPKKVVLSSRIGGKRVINMQVGEQLPRIC